MPGCKAVKVPIFGAPACMVELDGPEDCDHAPLIFALPVKVTEFTLHTLILLRALVFMFTDTCMSALVAAQPGLPPTVHLNT